LNFTINIEVFISHLVHVTTIGNMALAVKNLVMHNIAYAK